MIPDEYFLLVITELKTLKDPTKDNIQHIKKKISKQIRLKLIPSDADINSWILENDLMEEHQDLLQALKLKDSRTISGVAPVAVMTSPGDCPHGKCICCPGGMENGTPQSYTGHEPAALRAIRNNYDPFLQVSDRLKQLTTIGHNPEKVDLIIMGGTFTSREPDYQESFVKGCFDGLNGKRSIDLSLAQRLNEKAKHRCIGLTIETRPDHFKAPQIDRCLELGATRVELGVQSVFDDVLEKMERGHFAKDSIVSTKLAKDSGFKICYHMMPGLPGSDTKRDLESFDKIFTDPDFKPDMLKIYPTLVVKGTKLHDMWKKGEYEPLSTQEASLLVAKIKAQVPPWMRIQRIQRDIPANRIEAGIKKSNLRQLAQDEMKKLSLTCSCIRCREAGRSLDSGSEMKINSLSYDASVGKEYFLSVDDEHGNLYGFLRLRELGEPYRSELKEKDGTMIRELKVFGRALKLGQRDDKNIQHQGLGKDLMKEAYAQTKEMGYNKIFVNSGVGVRDYYRNLGFEKCGVFMAKELNEE